MSPRDVLLQVASASHRIGPRDGARSPVSVEGAMRAEDAGYDGDEAERKQYDMQP